MNMAQAQWAQIWLVNGSKTQAATKEGKMFLDDVYQSRLFDRALGVISDHEKPSRQFKPKVFQDGNMWCALYGSNLQDGVCGFGKTPFDAVNDFDNVWMGWKKDERGGG